MKGYYLYPDIRSDQIVFTSDDDVWKVSIRGGEAVRLTSDLGIATRPKISPDGNWVAFSRKQLGEQSLSEVYVIPIDGGTPIRLTYFGSPYTEVVGWNGDKVIVSSDYHRPFSRWTELFEVSLSGGQPTRLPYGNASAIARHGQITVIGRYTYDLTHWKRYRGGMRGKLWIDRDGNGEFTRFLEQLEGNLTSPCFVGDRVYFISDHEGNGNVYSADVRGEDLRRHTNLTEFYARNASSDGTSLVFHAGGDLYLLRGNDLIKLEVDIPSARKGASPKFVEVFKNMEDYSLHPNGKTSLLCVRGKPFVMGNFGGEVIQLGSRSGVRYRLPKFLPSGDSVVAVADTGEAEAVEVQGVLSGASKKIAELGTVEALEPSPDGSFVALSTAKNELWLVNMGDGSAKLLDSSKYGPITEVAWHEGSEWIAYSFPEGPFTQSLKLANAKNGKVYPLTSPTAYDFSPSFDPEGNFLYYLSARSLNASLDRAIFEMGFPRPVKPYLVSLSPRPSPFVKSTDLEKPPEKAGEKSPEEQKGISAVQIEGIQDRIEPFPIEEGNYAKVAGLRKSKVALLSFSAEAQPGKPSGAIDVFDVKTGSKERLISNVSGFSTNGSLLLVRAGEQLRVIDPERKPDLSVQEPGEKSGIIDASRIKVYVEPQDEWRQMLKETWRLMRENYWKEDLMGKNWEQVLNKYEKLLPRIGTRFELSDLIREMQGEMGTSHSYEIGGEYDLDRPYTVGGLGAEFEATESGYRITRLFEGDRSTEGEKSPLKSAGLTVGDLIVEIDGAPLDGQTHPSKALLNRGGDVISLKVIHNGKEQRVSVRVLKDERTLVYRDWVERNRGYVHEKSGEKLGYVHIPDMGGRGFSEFYRLYKAEAYRDGLIIDLRYNSGGFISSLLLEKLSRKRLGEERPRVGKPTPYPVDAPPAVMVALANEATGSDGDIFSHAFKMLKLGPLIGVRTWGGVIGINPRRRLVDGTVVTQPQFAFFFNDIGLGLENKGEEPDIAVDITPSDYASGRDVQLDKAIEEALRRLSAA